ncbi:MAG TPA: TIR domain-containing protein [Thermoanaerobaculia bacterium]|nr:TIR domain-containing protein [Thermoanaerobaculia bacterium]
MSAVERTVSSRAESAIETMRKRNPQLLRLAEAVSFAVIVDRALLRAARLELVPGADAGTEADLWFSSIIQSRTSDGLVLDRDVAEALRRRMSPAQVEEAWQVTAREHAGLSPSLKIEEEIAYLSVSAEPGAHDRMVRRIQSVIRAMLSGDRPGLAQWAARALAMFPSAIRDLPETRMLDAGTRIRLGQGVSTAAEEALPEWMSLVAPAMLARTQLQVELRERELVLIAAREPSGFVIDVPDTNPLVIEVAWESEGRSLARQVTLRRGETARVPVGNDVVRLRTISGEEYLVREAAKPSESLAAEVIDFSEEMARHQRFFGREEELARLLQMEGRVVIVGESGIGKTALLCELVRRLAPAPVFVHFFRAGEPRLESIEAASRSLAAQIAMRYRLDEAVVDLPLQQVLERLALSPRRPERLYIVIDDVQDATTAHGESPALALAEILPFVREFVTAYGTMDAFSGGYFVSERVDLTPADHATLTSFTGDPRLASLSEGNFGKAEVLRVLGESRPFPDAVAAIRSRWPEFVDLLAVTRRPLPNRVAGDTPKTLAFALRIDNRGVTFLNRTLRTAIVRIVPAAPEPHRALIRRLRSALDDDAVADYYTLFAPEHLLAAEAAEEAQRLVVDPTFMREVIRRHGVMVMRNHLRRIAKATQPTLETISTVDFERVMLALVVFDEHLDALIAQPDDLEAILAAYFPLDSLRLSPARLVAEKAERKRNPLPSRRHTEPITGCARIDENHVATWSSDGTLMLWPREERSLAPQVVRFDAPITAYVQVTDTFGVAGDALGFVHVVKTDNGEIVFNAAAHNDAVAGAAIAEGTPLVATWADDGVIRLWVTAPHGILEDAGDLAGHEDAVTGCAFTGGARLLVSSSRDGTIRVWSVAERRAVRVIRNDSPVVAMTVSSDGLWLAAVDEAGRLRVEPVEITAHFQAASVEAGHSARISGITRSEDDRFLATWSEDGFVVFWRMPLGEATAPQRGMEFTTKDKPATVATCAFIRYPPCLFASWTDGTAGLLSPESIRLTLETGGAVIQAVTSFDDERFCSGDDRGALVEWSPSLGTAVHDYSRAPERIDAVLAGVQVLVSNGDSVRFDRTEQKIALAQPHITVRGVRAALWSSSSGALYSAGLDTGRFHNVTQGTEGLLSACAVGARTHAAAAGHDDGAVLLFDSEIRVEAPVTPSRVTALAFIEDDTALLTGYASGGLTVSRESGSTTFEKLPARVVAIEVDDKRNIFATVSLDGTVRVHSVPESRLLGPLHGKVDPTIRCRFSLEGDLLIGAARDHTLRIWSTDNGMERAVARGHRAPITGLAVGEGVIYSASEDRTVRMWDINTGEQLAVVYGYNAFRCIDASGDVIVAGDDAGELWRFRRSEPALGGAQVFFSHSPQDDELVRRLRKDLLKWGVKVRVETAELTAGDLLRPKLLDAFSQSSAMVVITSPDAASSRWVQRELEEARSRSNVLLIQIAVGPNRLPFPGLTPIDLSNPRDPFAYDRAFTELMSRLTERFGGTEAK